MRFTDWLPPECVLPEVEARDGHGVLNALSVALAANTGVPAARLLELFEARERLCTTAVGHGVAIPHCRVEGLKQSVVCVGVGREGVDFGARDGGRVRLFVALVSPVQPVGNHLALLARIAALVRDPRLREALLGASSAVQLRALFGRAEENYVSHARARHELHPSSA